MPSTKTKRDETPVTPKGRKTAVKVSTPVADAQAAFQPFDDHESNKPHPLLQFLVLWNVFKYLNLEELKHSRLVCKVWNETAALFVPQRSEIRLYCNRKTKNVKADSKPVSRFSKFLAESGKFQRSSPFKVSNLTISRFGKEGQTCSCNNTPRRSAKSPPSCHTCALFDRCGRSVKELTLEQVPWSSFHVAMKTVFLRFPNIESLKVNYSVGPPYEIERRPDLSIPDDQPRLYSLKSFFLEAEDSNYRVVNISNVFDWGVLWKLAPQLADFTLKDNFRSLTSIMEAFVPFSKQLALKKLNIIAVDPYNDAPHFRREALAQALAKVIPNVPLKELVLDMNLSRTQWSLMLAGHLPPALHRLCISTDFCMGEDYIENPLNHFHRGDTTDRIFSILGSPLTVPASLQELGFYLTGARGMQKDVQLGRGFLKFDSVKDLSWVLIKKNAGSWEPLFPRGFEELATVFPSLRRLETTVSTKTSLRQLCRVLPHLEELIISRYSKLKFTDADITGVADASPGRLRTRITRHPSLAGLKKLRSLTLESNCAHLTDTSVYNGFLKIPELEELEIHDAPEFGPAALQALFDRNFRRLTIQNGDE